MTLYIIATPIGNLKDITLRALEILGKVDLVLAEDTRKTGQLLSHYKISKPLESLHEHNEERKIPSLLERLKNTEIALVSDAGTPLLSDPGFKLVREAIAKGIKIESIPGPSAVLTALTSSGLPTNQFLFLGYLPKSTGKQKETLDFVDRVTKDRPTTVIFFESPYRIKKTLELLAAKFPEKEVAIARELTKLHEEIIRGKVSEVAKRNIFPKGEFTVLLY